MSKGDARPSRSWAALVARQDFVGGMVGVGLAGFGMGRPHSSRGRWIEVGIAPALALDQMGAVPGVFEYPWASYR